MSDGPSLAFMVPVVGFKSRKAAQIAAYFALKSEKPKRGMIEKLKLIKLIYLSERSFLKQHHFPMLFDELYSLPHGPICSATLNGIDGLIHEEIWSEFVARNGNVVVAMRKFTRDQLDEISNAELKILKFIWSRFGKKTPSQLRNFSHKNCPEYIEITDGRIPIAYREVMEALGFDKSEAGLIDDEIQNIRREESVLSG